MFGCIRNRLFEIELSYVYLLYMYVTYMNLYSTYVRSNLSSAKFVLSRKAFCHKVKFSHLFFLLGMSWGLFCARSSAFYQMHIKVWSSDSYRQKTGRHRRSIGLHQGLQRQMLRRRLEPKNTSFNMHQNP